MANNATVVHRAADSCTRTLRAALNANRPQRSAVARLTAANETLRFLHYIRYRVDRFEVTFETDGVGYSIYDYNEYEEGTRHDRGVSITKPDGREVTLRCVGQVQSRMIDLESRLPCDPESALSACPTQSKP